MSTTTKPDARTAVYKIDRLFQYLDYARSDAPRNTVNPYEHEGGFQFQDLRDIRDSHADLLAACKAALLREDIADGELGDMLRKAVAKAESR